MLQIIPFTSDGARVVTVNFQRGVAPYEFRTYWNRTTRTWRMDIDDDFGNNLIAGVTLVTGVNTIRAYPTIEALLGQIHVTSSDNRQNRASDSLGNTSDVVQLPAGTIVENPNRVVTPIVSIGDVT